MKFSQQLHAELASLHEHFTSREVSARTEDTVLDDQILVVRCDGIKSSKRFLKDSLENPKYRNALHRAVETTYYIWRQWAPEENQPFLLGALRFSDEVSFFVNRGENYFQRRILKTTTSLASTLSSAMTLRFVSMPISRAPIVAFDGRPILLNGASQISSYIRWRRLLHARNSMAKTLRLRSSLSREDLYGGQPRLADEIHRLAIEVDARGLWREFEDASGGGSVYYHSLSEDKLTGTTLSSYPDDEHAVHVALRVWFDRENLAKVPV